MATTPAPSIPNHWFTEYHQTGRYCMQSLADYIAERRANGGLPLDRHCISEA